MSEVINVPHGWEVKALKSMGSCKNGLTYSPDDIVEGEGLLVLRSSNIKDSQIVFDDNVYVREDIKVNYKVQENDILVCVRNGSKNLIGKNALITKEAIGMAHGAFMTVFNSNINKYIFQLFQSDLFFRQVEKNLGATINSINNSDLILFEFPFPKEKKEQEKIAKILSTLDTAIESTQKLIDKEKNIKKGLMSDLLQNGIDKNGKIRTPKTHKYKDSELGIIPEEWEVDVVENHSKIITGNKDTQDRLDDGIYPFYVRSQTVERINSYSFDGEAVLTAGDGVGVGKVFHHVNEKFDFHQRVYCIHEFSKKLDSKFFFEYFKTYFIEQVNKYSAKGSVDSVRYDMIALMNIPMPNIDEQIKIAKILNIQDKKIEKEEENLAKLKELKKGLMRDLLSGKVRVKL
jgi:type I restriction enzyme S subunit